MVLGVPKVDVTHAGEEGCDGDLSEVLSSR